MIIDEDLEMLRSYEDGGVVMTNLDHSIDNIVEDALRAGGVYGQHTAWNFHGLVWWDGKQFCERVSRHHEYMRTYRANSLEDLMAVVNNDWGWE